jgi:putative CRISPR-associated protein (TIGR02620 family)
MEKILVVARHAALVEWLRQEGHLEQDYDLTPFVSDPAELRNYDTVIGVLPFHLAADVAEIGIVEMPGLRHDQRGREMGLDEMRAAGARLRWYRVERLYDADQPELLEDLR